MVVGPVHVQVSTYVWDVSVYALGVCQYIFVVINMHVHELCAHLCTWKRRGSLEEPVGLIGLVTHTILSGLGIRAWAGVGEPWELVGRGSGPGNGSRSDGEPAPHTAS